MALQSINTMSAPEAYAAIRSNAAGWKAQAQNALTAVQGGPVTTDFIFRMLDQIAGAIAALTTWKVVTGLDTYATAQGYTGTLSTDCATAITSANAVIAWVVANFPTSGGFLQDYTLNANGSRAPRSFSTVQTAGLATALTNFVATIG